MRIARAHEPHVGVLPAATLSELADKSDPLGDLATSIHVVREDLDALEALGYRDC